MGKFGSTAIGVIAVLATVTACSAPTGSSAEAVTSRAPSPVVTSSGSTLTSAPSEVTTPATASPSREVSTSMTASGGSVPTAETLPGPSAVASGHPDWWFAGAHVVSDPVVVGDAVAVYAIANDVYALTVIDPGDGKKIWSAAASPASLPPGQVLSPEVIGTDIVYVAPLDSSVNYFLGRVTVADGASGHVRAQSESVYGFADLPHRCDEGVCWQASAEFWCPADWAPYRGMDCTTLATADDGIRTMRMDISTGVVTGQELANPLPLNRSIAAEGLSDISVDGERFIGRIVDDAVQWQVPIETAFGPGFSTDYGWSLTYRESTGAFVGTVGHVHDDEVAHLGATSILVSLDADSGDRRWLRSGLSQTCIPGAVGDLSIACEFTPGTDVSIHDDEATFSDGSGMALVGYDTTDGSTLWSVPLADPSGRDVSDVFEALKPVSNSELLVNGRDWARVVDLHTGRTSTLGARVAWCSTGRDAVLGPRAGQEEASWRRHRVGAASHFACDATGAPVEVSGEVPDWIGVMVDNVFVYLSAQGLVGYRQLA